MKLPSRPAPAPVKRRTYSLTPEECDAFRALPINGISGNRAFAFWSTAARARGLDPATVIATPDSFTALPVGHGKHWCWPTPLKCKKAPPEFVPEAPRDAA